MVGLSFFKEIQEDLSNVEVELGRCVDTELSLLAEASTHLMSGGGKRLRPAFVLLSGRCHLDSLDKQEILPLAIALELIHMASLVHDDVVDSSYTRRGIPTVKACWGDQISLHTGSYLFAKSLVLVSNYKDPRIAGRLAKVSVEMCKGEIQQITTSYDFNQSMRDYFYRIKRKTALLLSASCELGALVAGAPASMIRALSCYGYNVGMAFQITDDILDMMADEQQLGKPVGNDLQQGIITLPAIFAIQNGCDKRMKELLIKRFKTKKEINELIKMIQQTGAIEASFEVAEKFVRKAKDQLAFLPKCSHRDTLESIADFIQVRKY